MLKIDYKVLLPSLILSAFLLICLAPKNKSVTVQSAEIYSQGQFEPRGLAESKSGDEGSEGMATNPVSKAETTARIMAASLTTSIGNNSHRAGKRASGFSNVSVYKYLKDQCKNKNTLSLVDSNLGHQFTLLGEKPSGTS